MRQSNKENRGRRYLLSALLLLAAAAILSFAGVTAARYVKKEERSGVAEAQAFFVSSDLLKEPDSGGSVPYYYIDPKMASFSVKLYNWADSERVTNTDIKYTVGTVPNATVTDSGKGILHGTAGSNTQSEAVITVKLPESPAKKITVTVQTAEPYSRTLQATFELAEGNQYRIEDSAGNIAASLIMTCTDFEKDITVSFDSSLSSLIVPDNTDSRVKGSGGNYTFHSPGQGIYTLTLLKTDTDLNLSQSNKEFADSISIPASANTAQ